MVLHPAELNQECSEFDLPSVHPNCCEIIQIPFDAIKRINACEPMRLMNELS
jgi:hypothetical protein